MLGKVSLTGLNDLDGATEEVFTSGLALAVVLMTSFIWDYSQVIVASPESLLAFFALQRSQVGFP